MLFLTVCIVLTCSAMSGSAAEQAEIPDVNMNLTGTLFVELSCEDNNGQEKVFEGITLQVFQTADLKVENGTVEYMLCSAFADTDVSFTGVSASESSQEAILLSKSAGVKGTPTAVAVTDQNGKAQFENLSHGIYLVVMKEDENTDSLNLQMDPYLVSLPMAEKADGGYRWNYVVFSHPKASIESEDKKGSIIVTKKTSVYDEDSVIPVNSADEVFYFGLFRDAEGTRPYADNFMKSIHLVNASSGTVIFENLPEGTYYVFETDSVGIPVKDGDKVVGGVMPYTCVVEGDGTQEITFDSAWENSEGQVIFNNIYDWLTEGYYYEPEIKVTKYVFEGDKKIRTDETFYAGIFSKEHDTYILEQVFELKQNGTVKIPFYVQLTEADTPVTYWIFETDENGIRVDQSTFGYIIEGEGTVELSSQKTEVEITIINRKDVPETETETDASSGSTPNRSVRTGDDSPILLYACVMAAALLVIILLLVMILRRRRR